MSARAPRWSAALATVSIATPVLAQSTPPWTHVATGRPPPRSGHRMAYDSVRGVTVMYGGSHAGQPRTDTWEWDGAVWLQKASVGPSIGGHMAFDSRRGKCVLFGGPYLQTWEWDGIYWVQRYVPGVRPDSMGGHAMAFDSHRNVTVLHGGWNGQHELGGTWTWDGTVWAQRGGTQAKASPTMAFDSDRGVIVLFGGENWPPRHFDTQEWNGSWQLRATTGPTGRVGHAMAYDPDARVMLLFGGASDLSWEWDGTTWTRHQPEGGPRPDYPAAMVYDTRRRRAVYFDGEGCNSSNGQPGTWERASTAGWCYANCDGSTGAPVLNVADFICFLNRFATGDPYANCDISCGTLNVSDFTCFMNQYAAGCP